MAPRPLASRRCATRSGTRWPDDSGYRVSDGVAIGMRRVTSSMRLGPPADPVTRSQGGMFGYAIWDERRRLLLVARDRLGIKPLYYWPNADGVAFASELRALLALPGGPRAIDHDAVAEYIALGHVPEPRPFWPASTSFRPATCLRGHVTRECASSATGLRSAPSGLASPPGDAADRRIRPHPPRVRGAARRVSVRRH